ncbi:ArsR/SmtB family transcription factor [Streptomyces sp. NRRL B-24484]|uniref:ArsR/SmtB family transcription factor n=1 Tax=Streptomyces sp. NRRL B-24484 TaxID=1463833 RepID=UPI0006948E41|nr:metalloregulator ArsR/SmtB family transcription factor [Streptomyces sp. NRRL B-24484]
MHRAEAGLFRALAHPARIRLLELLGGGERPVADLTRALGVKRPYLSQQLAVLRRTGLIATRRSGTAAHCSLTDPLIAELLALADPVLAEATGVRRAVPQVPPPRPPA